MRREPRDVGEEREGRVNKQTIQTLLISKRALRWLEIVMSVMRIIVLFHDISSSLERPRKTRAELKLIRSKLVDSGARCSVYAKWHYEWRANCVSHFNVRVRLV